MPLKCPVPLLEYIRLAVVLVDHPHGAVRADDFPAVPMLLSGRLVADQLGAALGARVFAVFADQGRRNSVALLSGPADEVLRGWWIFQLAATPILGGAMISRPWPDTCEHRMSLSGTSVSTLHLRILDAFTLVSRRWHLVLRPAEDGETGRMLRCVTATHT